MTQQPGGPVLQMIYADFLTYLSKTYFLRVTFFMWGIITLSICLISFYFTFLDSISIL